MAINLTNFLFSLASAMAGVVTGPAVTLGGNLFVNEAVESDSTANPYAVMVNYGGPIPEDMVRIPEISIQVMVTGNNTAAAQNLAQQLFESLYEPETDDGWPGPVRNSWTIPGLQKVDGVIVEDADVTQWNIHCFMLKGTPGMLGRDEFKRAKVCFNFDVRFDF